MIITLSRQLGSRGDEIAARVSAALGLKLVDREYVYQAALAAGVPEELLHKLTYEGQQSMAADLLDTLSGSGLLRDAPAQAPTPLLGIFAPMLAPTTQSLEEAAATVGLVIKDIASRGDILLLGQGGQSVLQGYENACHVQLVAPFELRAARIAEVERLTLAAARRRVRASDTARAEYVARFYGVRWLDPLLYHLVVNTGQTRPDVAVSLIMHAAQAVAHNR